ncbi:MAG: KTSC domain-containing protein [Verrucomicrobia bacterium]|nr:KTSC domain-containing protein [Verrucomicrobiota bacterium]
MRLNSSDLKWAEYDDWSGTLTIGFHSGGVYEYYSVPAWQFSGLINAESHGRYFHQNIKGQYRYRRIRRTAMIEY